MGLQALGCARHVGCLFRPPVERSVSRWAGDAAPFALSPYPKGFPQSLRPTRILHPHQCPPLLVCHTPIPVLGPLFLCRCPKTASADTLTLWAGLSCAGWTCSWAGLTHPPHRSQSIPASSAHSPKPTEAEWRKALTTDTSANGS